MTASSPKPSPRPSQSTPAADNASPMLDEALDSAAAALAPITTPLTKPLSAADDARARTPEKPADPSIGKLVATATESLSTLLRSEIELAKLELRSTVKNGLTGAGAFIAALAVVLFALPFLFIAAAEALALVLPRWASFLIVFGALLLVAGVLVFLGIKKVKRVRAPEKTIASAKETVDYLKSQRG